MGVHTRKPDHAWHGHGARRINDRRKPSSGLCRVASDASRLVLALSLLIFMVWPAWADTLRVATFDTELSRKGPGLMLRDISRNVPQVDAVATIIAQTAPDIIAIQGVDWDMDRLGLLALRDAISNAGHHFSYVFAHRPNAGLMTPFDLDGNGITGEPRDAQGYGRFSGQGGMAILSRWPIDEHSVQDFSDLLWRDLPNAQMPYVNNAPFPSKEVHAVQRLSSTGHWVVPIHTPHGPISMLTFDATPPVFDGPEDRNGLRNADEITFWAKFMDQEIGRPINTPFVILGNANLDSTKGQGRHHAIRTLLTHPMLQDPMPQTQAHGTDTVDWTDPVPGDMRVDYVLPARSLRVVASGVVWPSQHTHAALSLATIQTASRHRLVWVDLKY